jgi:hypothetical protein
MRFPRLLLKACFAITVACSSSSSPSTGTSDASAPPGDDASMVPCTSAGGTCVSYTTTCPVLQQNPTLCGNSVLLCCLPPDDAGTFVPPGPDSGEESTDAAPEAAGD